MNNWLKTKNHRKFSNKFSKVLLSENVYNATLFAMHYVNLKIRYSQYVSLEKTTEKCKKSALFGGFLAKKVSSHDCPRPIFLPLIKHNISYFFIKFHRIRTRHFLGPRERKIENDYFFDFSNFIWEAENCTEGVHTPEYYVVKISA